MQEILDIAERMKQDLIMAIAAEQVFRPAAANNGLIQCFNVGYASDGFNLLRHSLLFLQVMALMRLWDDTGNNVRSIIKLEGLLSDAGSVAKLVLRERQAAHDLRQVDTTFGETEQQLPFSDARSTPDQREHELRTRVSSWLIEVAKAKGGAEIARVRKYRHEIIAHNAGPSRRPRVPLPSYGDEQKALERTIPIVSEGFRLATGTDYDFTSTMAVWRNIQDDLWEIVRHASRGETFAPTPRNAAAVVQEMVRRGIQSIEIKG
jgi:hypothetical protein